MEEGAADSSSGMLCFESWREAEKQWTVMDGIWSTNKISFLCRRTKYIVLMDMCGIQLVVSLTFKSTSRNITLLSFLSRLVLLALWAESTTVIIVITHERDERASVNIVLMDMWYSICCFICLQEHTISNTTLLFFLSHLALWAEITTVIIVITYERDEQAFVNIVLIDMWYAIGCFT
jgi:hypothetical protein